jgi:hypothetical protein
MKKYANVIIAVVRLNSAKIETHWCGKLYMIMDILQLSIYTSMQPSLLKPWALALWKTFLDTMSDVLDKCWCFSLIKIESVSVSYYDITLLSEKRIHLTWSNLYCAEILAPKLYESISLWRLYHLPLYFSIRST